MFYLAGFTEPPTPVFFWLPGLGCSWTNTFQTIPIRSARKLHFCQILCKWISTTLCCDLDSAENDRKYASILADTTWFLASQINSYVRSSAVCRLFVGLELEEGPRCQTCGWTCTSLCTRTPDAADQTPMPVAADDWQGAHVGFISQRQSTQTN